MLITQFQRHFAHRMFATHVQLIPALVDLSCCGVELICHADLTNMNNKTTYKMNIRRETLSGQSKRGRKHKHTHTNARSTQQHT